MHRSEKSDERYERTETIWEENSAMKVWGEFCISFTLPHFHTSFRRVLQSRSVTGHLINGQVLAGLAPALPVVAVTEASEEKGIGVG
jgi:hypothetical protein